MTIPVQSDAPPVHRRSRRALALVIGSLLVLIVALAAASVPLHTTGGIACGGAGGALRWRLGGASQQRQDAADDAARMQQGLDSMLKDPAVAASPMGKELIEDAHDEQGAAQAKLAANDGCDRDADARLEASGLGLVVAIVALLAGERVLAALRRRRRARQAARDRVAPDAPLAVLRCPACGAELDDPLGCWNCGAFQDGDVWRTPTAAPPDAARQLSLSSLDDRRRRRR